MSARPFAVQDPDPSLGKVINHFKASDIAMMAGFTAASAPFGWYTGGPLRKYQVIFCTFVGAASSFGLAVQNSHQRLVGLREP
mmetsp:Transcript_20907/g.37040  ORF Transcript_20907/g.37040 Transcript_20907/m.37040 type:complete len:83 (+) Transcript_20907:153-401(+)|eukprot:CAMPEP_0184518890 /NCGR_PEP_ID=MMETSP0198_2-20121128/6326_1 /TAXON_ID=1112570 /ORGANISM="Thraustochytrium sp., Strain LLF1b" /LENGTH=82 /DNA_ID=CAMNT_0026909353 /DNA_START=122 /DNA_END=370 /DNA_ORIENTATION=-